MLGNCGMVGRCRFEVGVVLRQIRYENQRFCFLSHDGDSFTSCSRSSYVVTMQKNYFFLFFFFIFVEEFFRNQILFLLFLFSLVSSIVENPFSNAGSFCEQGYISIRCMDRKEQKKHGDHVYMRKSLSVGAI